MRQKYSITIMKWWTILEKSLLSIVDLKIVGATPQLDQNSNQKKMCRDNFLFLYKFVWV